ncbi:tetratricopeptide repeat protein [Leptospira selangorensis]|uniref:Tetratricopeptide repeat protein n=1 Tax=Leptospira selangorensis TaxID=2484982 RepID=A0A5F2BXF9_9LEPT|nr:tetratricopeptide repeat protein [Leptospira selangorensis]TGM12183.1 tetratricopeptide repeat protein [Leptospira selangorensis]TGM14774.1 tetratricopeptide repeat protein [Leptospira selangorensis]
MKFLLSSLYVLLLCFPGSFLFAGDPDLEKGIQLYKEKKNYDALGYLEKSLKKEKTGIAFYYRGNVKMNLQDYEEAVSSYTEAYRLDYKRTDSLFNIACAYSLSGQSHFAAKALLLNFLRGDKNLTRISKDPDLANFRKTKDYPLLISVMEKPEGVPLRDRKEISDFLKQNDNRFIFYEYDTPSPGGIRFESGGLLHRSEGGGYAGIFYGGEWKLSENGLESNLKILSEKKTYIKFLKKAPSII